MRRAWALVFAGLLVVVIGALVAVPWWLGAALRGAGHRFGTTFTAYHRIGYTRFALDGVRLERSPVVVTVSHLEADTPLVWLWRHARGQATPILAGDWTVQVSRPATPAAPTPSGWVILRGRLKQIARALDRWLPEAQTGTGRVQWPGGGLTLRSAQWETDTLHVTELRYGTLAADAKALFLPNDLIRVTAITTDRAGSAALDSEASAVKGSVTWWNQRAAVDAKFADEGWIPANATVRAQEIRLPAERLKLGDQYASVSGQAFLSWQIDRFFTDIDLKSEPAAGKNVPPLQLVVRGRGDARTFTVDALHLALPGVLAELSAPVTIDRAGWVIHGTPNFAVHADLTKQPWFRARGQVVAQARVVSGLAQIPEVEFSANATDLAAAGIAMSGADMNGRFAWPLLSIAHATVTAVDGAALRAVGAWNFRAREIVDASADGSVSRDTLSHWLPPSVRFERIAIHAQVSGPIARLNHHGRVETTALQVGSIRPANLALAWQGVGTDVSVLQIDATAGPAHLTANGSATASGVEIRALRFEADRQLQLVLVQPVRVTWQPALSISPLRLQGPSASLAGELTWGTAGKIALDVHEFKSSWVDVFVPLRGPTWTIQSLAFTGKWQQGPMNYTTAGGAVADIGNGRVGTINVAAHGGGDGLRIDALHVVENGHDVINATGRLPVTIAPAAKSMVVLDQAGPVELSASTVSNAAFWRELADTTGIELRDPEVKTELSGTWTHPRGTVVFRATRVAMDPKRFARPVPTIEDIDAALTGEIDRVRLERFTFKVEGQLVRASGELPAPRRGWEELAHDPMTFLREGATLRIEVPDAQVAMFSRFLPAALAPMGRLQADLHYDHGALGGFLRLRDAASRPLGPLGVLQGVSADVLFSGHRIDLQRVVATAGGEPITLSGSVELPTAGWLTVQGGEPKYDIAVRGKNLPFVRQAGLLVRGDLDLKLQSPAMGAPRISGQVKLRDSLFLADVRSFLPHGGGASPDRRPPYFSVNTPPLNTWGLDIDVLGTRFMRLKTPVFSGIASTHFHLGGTLGEPRAIGDATIDEGSVLMPFATFTVAQGVVRLSEEDPTEPTIFLRGTGQHFGYDLTLEVTGKASSPNITFRSSPALDPDQVLLMVMTGAAPTNEVNTSVSHRALQIGAFFGQNLLGGIMGGSASPDRLSIASGEKVSEQGNETYDIEYKLNDRWTLTGEYDEFDEYNVGFKWRIAPKKLHK